MSGKTRDAYAEVKDSDGTTKSGVQVVMNYDVVPDNDGKPQAEHNGSINPNGGTTDADGRLNFTFTAPEAGGTHLFVAGCTNCSNQDTGQIRVTGCKVPLLSAPPFTDSVADGFEKGNRWRPDLLTPDYQKKLKCVTDAAGAGHYSGTSAYRPTQYQQHLYEIVDRDRSLSPRYMSAHPECQLLRNTVTNEMKDHGLKSKQKVAIPGYSNHEYRKAFDLTLIGLTDAEMNQIYTSCGVTHTAVRSEPWHTQ